MKTKDLIKQLTELDPSGELDVTVGNVPIYFAEKLPAYYDGPKCELKQDFTLKGYNITGYKITDKGEKIKLYTVDLESFLTDNNFPELVDLSELSEKDQAYYKKRIQYYLDEVNCWEELENISDLERHF